jgi:hypothetical protein
MSTQAEFSVFSFQLSVADTDAFRRWRDSRQPITNYPSSAEASPLQRSVGAASMRRCWQQQIAASDRAGRRSEIPRLARRQTTPFSKGGLGAAADRGPRHGETPSNTAAAPTFCPSPFGKGGWGILLQHADRGAAVAPTFTAAAAGPEGPATEENRGAAVAPTFTAAAAGPEGPATEENRDTAAAPTLRKRSCA